MELLKLALLSLAVTIGIGLLMLAIASPLLLALYWILTLT